MSNRHFERLKQIYNFIPVSYRNGGAVDFSCFTTPVDEDEFAAKDRLNREQGEAIFQLPPGRGANRLKKRTSSLKKNHPSRRPGGYISHLMFRTLSEAKLCTPLGNG